MDEAAAAKHQLEPPLEAEVPLPGADVVLVLVGRGASEDAEHAHEEEKPGHDEGGKAEVDEEDVEGLVAGDAVHRVHDQGEGEEEVGGLAEGKRLARHFEVVWIIFYMLICHELLLAHIDGCSCTY